jgi:hypothetical protein
LQKKKNVEMKGEGNDIVCKDTSDDLSDDTEDDNVGSGENIKVDLEGEKKDKENKGEEK